MSDHTTDDARTPPSAWIFQCNPRHYDLSGALDELDELTWVMRRHTNDIQPGDLVYLWESGSKAGVVAVTRVLTPPMEGTRDTREESFYRVPERFEGNDPRVRLRVEQVLVQRLLRDELQDDPQLLWRFCGVLKALTSPSPPLKLNGYANLPARLMSRAMSI